MQIIHKAVYTCEEASQLVVMKRDRKLPLTQRIRLWMHLAMCTTCRRFNIQNKWIDDQLHKLTKSATESEMPEDAKQRIANRLNSEQSGDAPNA